MTKLVLCQFPTPVLTYTFRCGFAARLRPCTSPQVKMRNARVEFFDPNSHAVDFQLPRNEIRVRHYISYSMDPWYTFDFAVQLFSSKCVTLNAWFFLSRPIASVALVAFCAPRCSMTYLKLIISLASRGPSCLLPILLRKRFLNIEEVYQDTYMIPLNFYNSMLQPTT